MKALLIFVYPIAEIILLFEIGGRIGIVNTFFLLLSCFVLGVGLAKAQGRTVLFDLQTAASQGRLPDNRVLNGLILMFGGILLAIPGFISDVIAILFILPGTRHLVAFALRKRFERQVKSGQFGKGGFGSFGNFRLGTFSGFGSGFGGAKGRATDGAFHSSFEPPYEREVTPRVIDVAPISQSETEDESESRAQPKNDSE